MIIGSARSDENGGLIGGKAGDQNNREVSTQKYYMHKKGWYLLRAEDISVANAIAKAMLQACNNPNIGYDQGQRDSMMTLFRQGHSISEINKPCEVDCSKLVQICVYQATGKDPGNFTTANAVTVLSNTGKFKRAVEVQPTTTLYDGDILCTKTKGHIVVVVSGNPRKTKSISITSVAKEVIAGEWGTGEDRKRALKAAGFDYDEVQQKVNDLLK